MIAVVPVRGGVLPLGADETVAEAGGAAIVVGSDAELAAKELLTAEGEIVCVDLGPFAPGRWAGALVPLLDDHRVVVLPASPDGRDLAPRLAFALDRPLLAGAISVTPERIVLARQGGLVAEEHVADGPFVATLEPGVRGFEPVDRSGAALRSVTVSGPASHDAEVLAVLPPDPATVDLSEATRIVAGGAGLAGADAFATLRRVGAALGASWGASRVAADLGWVPQDRFIGTTGVTVTAKLYVALAISGAVQHVTGLGDPDHIIAVNTDGSAPMMGMADLAIVSDARAVLDELAVRLGVPHA